MGSGYLYSFDISVLLFGVCFNLAGLPYSAGFLGKEFLFMDLEKNANTSTSNSLSKENLTDIIWMILMSSVKKKVRRESFGF